MPPPLFRALADLMSDQARIAVIANGTPLWLQDSAWSRALRAHLEDWLGMTLTSACGTDPASRAAYRRELERSGFSATDEVHLDYAEPVTVEGIVGNVYSAMSPDRLPTGAARTDFEARLGAALHAAAPDGRFVEDVRVSILVGAR